MSSYGDLELKAAELGADCRDHVLRLLGTWAVLSDLSFSDLLLVTPQDVPGGIVLEVIGQVRPATSATLVRSDLVGESLRVRRMARGRSGARERGDRVGTGEPGGIQPDASSISE